MDLIEKSSHSTKRHPWEISRANSILRILKRKSAETQYADIGAGDLFFAGKLSTYSNKPIYAVDINYKYFGKADKIILCKSVSDIPKHSIDCIILMDVLEHIKEDYLFLEELKGILKDNGEVIITVPAHQYLFSTHDVSLKHYRRYNKKQLVSLLEKAGFRIKEKFYFYTVLLVARCFQIILSRLDPFQPRNAGYGVGNWRFNKNNIVTVLNASILKIDFFINKILQKIGINSTGLSLCVICRKKFA